MQTVNEFLGFKAIFNANLADAIEATDLARVENILQDVYDWETENNIYTQEAIDFDKIKKELAQHTKDIENDPSLIFKL